MQRIAPALLTAAAFFDALRQSKEENQSFEESNKVTITEENTIQANDAAREPDDSTPPDGE